MFVLLLIPLIFLRTSSQARSRAGQYPRQPPRLLAEMRGRLDRPRSSHTMLRSTESSCGNVCGAAPAAKLFRQSSEGVLRAASTLSPHVRTSALPCASESGKLRTACGNDGCARSVANERRRSWLATIAVVAALSVVTSSHASADDFQTLYSFPGGSEARSQREPCRFGSILYGTTSQGGAAAREPSFT